MNTISRLIAGFAVVLILGGCATSRSELDIAMPAIVEAQPSSSKTVFIAAPSDERVFHENPGSPNVPSLDPGKVQNEEITQRAVGRKRNTYGKALGDIVLKEGATVSGLTLASIAKAYGERGYRVLENAEDATPDTLFVQPTIKQFWSWLQPGFWAITISTEIGTDLAVKSATQDETINVSVKAEDHFQTGADGNWIQVMNKALQMYVEELKAKIAE